MSKKILAAFILLLIAFGIAVACALSPPVSSGVYEFFVNILGRNIVTWFTGVMTGMMAWGATALGPAMAIALGWSIGAIIFWTIVLNKYIWKRYIKKEEKPSTALPPPYTAPQTIVIREEATPTRTVVAPEKKAEEQVAAA
jgi:hypothetical protein